jgi:site-specific DNA recombinase
VDSTSTMGQRAVVYARVSSDDTGKEDMNLRSQVARGRKYCAENGYEVVAELVEDDRGASGRRYDLEQLQTALRMAKNGEYDVFVVRDMMRFSRNGLKQRIVEEQLEQAGVRVEFVLQKFEKSPYGRFSKHVLSDIGELEADMIAERTTAGRRDHVRAGYVQLHGHQLYGYNLVKQGVGRWKLVIYEEEAQWVRRMFHWYTVGDETGRKLSMREITLKLDEMGAPTPAQRDEKVFKLRDRDAWAYSSVRKMLQNEAYAGRYYYGKQGTHGVEETPVEVPALIDEDTWQEAQARRVVNRDQRRRYPHHEYLMSGRLKCNCGYRVGGAAHYGTPRGTPGRKAYLMYRCPARLKGTAAKFEKCQSRDRRADRVDAVVWSWIRAKLDRGEETVASLRHLEDEQAAAMTPLRDRVAAIDVLVERRRAEIKKLYMRYAAEDGFGDAMLDELMAGKKEEVIRLEAERREVVAKIADDSITQEEVNALLRFVTEIRAGLPDADVSFAKRRWVIDMLDVTGQFVVVDGVEMLDLECHLGGERLALLASSS